MSSKGRINEQAGISARQSEVGQVDFVLINKDAESVCLILVVKKKSGEQRRLIRLYWVQKENKPETRQVISEPINGEC